MRKLGLRFGSIHEQDAVALGCVGNKSIAVIDAETGEEIDNVAGVTVNYDVREAISATVKFFPVRLDGVPQSIIDGYGLKKNE